MSSGGYELFYGVFGAPHCLGLPGNGDVMRIG